ncbi:MAG: DUF3054 domain-containing protein [Chloroflexi bacterium]|nr:DUF3054 domain-containing protein [Chloroflexota bacterium]
MTESYMSTEESPLLVEPPIEYAPSNPDKLPIWEFIVLALGDLLGWLIFAAVGRASHGLTSGGGPIVGTINTAMPFMVAWLMVALATGTFSGKALYPLQRVLLRSGLTGLLAAPLGVLLRSLWESPPALTVADRFAWALRDVQPSFLLVATLTGTLILLLWRVGWSRLRRLWWDDLP